METAAEYVLALPELVSMILRWVYFADVQVWYSAIFAFVGRFEYSRRHIGRATLALAARVNKLWFYEAMRLQWADPSRMSPHSIQLLIGSLPSLEKRQFYAGFVKSGMVPECHSKDVKANGRFVKGVIFPKLRALRYRLAAETKRIFLADINAPEVDTLHIQFRGQEHKKLEGGDKVVHRLIKVVKKRYPKLRTVYFEYPSDRIYRETMNQVARSYKVFEWPVHEHDEELDTKIPLPRCVNADPKPDMKSGQFHGFYS